VLAQGLPIPANAEAAARMVAAVHGAGATPAITAVVAGRPTLGLTTDELERFLRRDGIGKVSARDLAVAMALGRDGATTVAGSLALCAASGTQVLATGGIGGVHREPAFDESADLIELSRTRAITVCAGAKSILDLPATVERLETLGVAVIGFRTSTFPGFFFEDTGLPVTARVERVEEIVEIFSAGESLKSSAGLLVVQPPPAREALSRDEVERAVAQALAEARDSEIRGAAMTPFLLAAIERATSGRSQRVNLSLLEANADLAARVARRLSDSHL